MEPQPATRQQSAGRIGVLDAFRGLAILSVMLFHYTFRWGPNAADGQNLTGAGTSLGLFAYGWVGVEFFFIISGFVIFMTAEKSRTVTDFAISRFSRIYPTFIFCMTVSFLVELAIAPPALRGTLTQYLVGFTMQSTHFKVNWIDGAYWSLLVELKFYFWIAVFYFGLRRWFVPAWVLFCLAGIAFSFVSYRISEVLMIAEYTPFFSIGMAYYLRYRQGRFSNDSIALYGIAAVSYAMFWVFRTAEDASAGYQIATMNGLVLVMLLLFEGFVRDRLAVLKQPVLLYIGLISYPLYLLHQAIGVSLVVAIDRVAVLNGIPALVLAAAAVFALTALVHRYVEDPSRRWVRKSLEKFVAHRAAAWQAR